MERIIRMAFYMLVLVLAVGVGAGCGGSSVSVAEKHLKKGNNAKAIEVLKEGIKGQDSTNARAYAMLARAYYADTQYDEAAINVMKAQKRGLSGAELKELQVIFGALWGIVTNNAITKYNQALDAIRVGKKDAAKMILDTAKVNAETSVAIQPDSGLGYTVLANICIINEEYEKAVNILKDAIKKTPKDPQNYIQLSNIYTQYLGQKNEDLKIDAILVLEEARKAVGDVPEVIRQLAVAYIANGQITAAEDATKKLVEQKPNDKFSHYLYGIVLGTLAEKGQPEKYDLSLAEYQKVIDIAPDFEEAVYNYAYISFRKAEDDFTKNAAAFVEEEKKKRKEKKGKKEPDPVYTGHQAALDAAIAKLKPLAEAKNKKEYWELIMNIYSKKGNNAAAEDAMKKAKAISGGETK